MGVEGTASPEAIIQAVETAGYGASKKGAPGAAAVKGPGDSGIEAETDLVTGIFSSSHVFFHGTHDVELAGSGVDGRKPYRYGAAADDPGSHRDGDQPEVFYQWF